MAGLSGIGKSYLACALAKACCRKRIRCAYILEELWREAKLRPAGERKSIRKYEAFSVLVMDEWLLERPDERFRSFILEIMELRYGTASTIFCTQYKQKDWHSRL